MDIRVFESLPNDAMKVRQEVFVEEQGFVDEFDDIDKTAIHIVAYDGNEAVGTCRVFYDDDKASYVLGRLAVAKIYRGANLGSLLLREAEKQVLYNGGDRLILHSQCAAVGFYQKNGYQEYGDIEDDQGCPHIWMKKNLRSINMEWGEGGILKKTIRVILVLIALIILAVAGLLLKLQIQTGRILTDYSAIYENEKYSIPVYAEGVEVITQDVSCGYACIEMFSAWNGGNLTEEDLYCEYGKVVTSTGDKFCEEMNKRFPEYTTTIHKYMTNTELIDAAYDNLANGVPVPFEWAAKYGDVWTLHYSLLIGMDIPNDRITVANPYGYIEEISVDDFLRRTSFEAYEGMPFYFKLAFAIGIFEKNTIFTVQ